MARFFVRKFIQRNYNPKPHYLPISKKYSFHKCCISRWLCVGWERCNGFNGRHNPLLSQLFWADFARLPYQ